MTIVIFKVIKGHIIGICKFVLFMTLIFFFCELDLEQKRNIKKIKQGINKNGRKKYETKDQKISTYY